MKGMFFEIKSKLLAKEPSKEQESDNARDAVNLLALYQVCFMRLMKSSIVLNVILE